MQQTVSDTQVVLDISTLQELSISTIYLMGFSFILGSAFTVLLLLLLDFMRSLTEENN